MPKLLKCPALIGLGTKSGKNKMYGLKWKKVKMYGLKVHLRLLFLMFMHLYIQIPKLITNIKN